MALLFFHIIVDFYCNYFCIYMSLICLKRGLNLENKFCHVIVTKMWKIYV